MIKKIWGISLLILVSLMVMPSLAGAEATVIWDGEVDLNGGIFDYIPASNQSASYEWSSLTDLGALQTASEAGGFEINSSDLHAEYGSFFINSIDGTSNEENYTWSILINDETVWNGLGLNELNDGDKVTFYYLEWVVDDAGNYVADVENATQMVNIKVNDATVIWDGEVDLNGGIFDYTPAANPSASYEWKSLTDLGALQAASEAGGFGISTSDYQAEYESFYINSIDGIANEEAGGYSWSILINDETTWNGLGRNSLNDGDSVTFCYVMWIEESPGNWVADVDNAAHIVSVKVNDVTVIWDGEVDLEDDTFDYIPASNLSASYELSSLTDLGALQDASEKGDFEFAASDDYYATYGSFYITSINGIANEGNYSWCIQINDEFTTSGLGANDLSDGDTVTFYYAEYDENWVQDIENASYKVNIDASVAPESEDESSSSSSSSSRSSSSSSGIARSTAVETVEEEETNVSEEPDTVYSVIDEEPEEEPESIDPTKMSVESNVDSAASPGFEAVFAVAGFLLSAIFLAKRRM